jgi:hypothetical protein
MEEKTKSQKKNKKAMEEKVKRKKKNICWSNRRRQLWSWKTVNGKEADDNSDEENSNNKEGNIDDKK